MLTVSDTRTKDDDRSGKLIVDALSGAGHEVVGYEIVKDEPEEIRGFVDRMAEAGQAEALLITGGTGITARDGTYEAIAGLLEKRLDGFGELFRMLSYEEIGAAAMLSRAVAGTHRGMVIFSMPGSTAAVRLAMEKLIVPEIGHAVGHAQLGLEKKS